jgi:hypothetical protein
MSQDPAFVFDASPIIAGCSFRLGADSIAELVLVKCQIVVSPAVYDEVVTRGGARPDALEAGRLVTTGRIQVAAPATLGAELADLQYYALGAGDKESLTLTARLQPGVTLITDDFLVLVIAARLGLPHQLFLDFVVDQATRGSLTIAAAKHAVQAVGPRYPQGFVPHSLACLDRIVP